MSHYTLGIDTSNYATSLAVFHTAGEVVCAKKRFLPVKEGQLGLRQSDALFHHTAALPEMLEELGREFDLTISRDTRRQRCLQQKGKNSSARKCCSSTSQAVQRIFCSAMR